MFTIVGELNDADCQVDTTCSLADLMTEDSDLCRDERRAYRNNDDASPLRDSAEAPFLLHFLQRHDLLQEAEGHE